MGVAADLSRTHFSLLQRIRNDKRDQQAWREFVNRYGKLIFEWCVSRGLQGCDAEDVTQEVLVKLSNKLASFEYDPGATFRGWLRRITENAVLDFARGRRRDLQGRFHGDADEILSSVGARAELVDRLEAAFDLELFDLAKSRVRTRVELRRWKAWELTAIHQCDGLAVSKQLNMKLPTVYSSRYQVQKMITEELARLEAETTEQLHARSSNGTLPRYPR